MQMEGITNPKEKLILRGGMGHLGGENLCTDFFFMAENSPHKHFLFLCLNTLMLGTNLNSPDTSMGRETCFFFLKFFL